MPGDADQDWNGVERRAHTLRTQQEILSKLILVSEQVEKVVRFIEGNGKPERGAVVRLDRLEQRMVIVWGLALTVGGLVLKTVVDVMTK